MRRDHRRQIDSAADAFGHRQPLIGKLGAALSPGFVLDFARFYRFTRL
jgi:hypothetical protein